MNIHPVNHAKGDSNRWCGPSALSIITGMNTGEAARLLRRVSGKRSIKGTGTGTMARALSACGLRTITRHDWRNVDPKKRPTLTQWLKDSVDMRTAGRVFLVAAGHHWQVISGRRYCCGQVNEIISIKDKRVKRRARVSEVIEIKLSYLKSRIEIPAAARKPKKTIDPAKKEVTDLLKKLGTKGRVVREGGYTDYRIDPCPQFPNGLECCHFGWYDTLERIELAIEEPERIDEGNFISL